MHKVIDDLPEDAGLEDAIERFQLLLGVEKGLAQIKEGKTVSNEEVMKRIEKWLS